MAVDDDLFIVSMFSKGWLAIICIVLFFVVVVWQCSQENKCESRDLVYLKDQNVCVDKSVLEDP